MSPGYLIKQVLNRTVPGKLVLHRRFRDNAAIALTFDDGPHPSNTPKILDTLAEYDAKATFFVQGSEAEKYPALVREMIAKGHQVANHGFNHLDSKQTQLGEYIADVNQAQDRLRDIVGQDISKTFRPPYGSITLASFLALTRLKYRYVYWSIDTRDSYIRVADTLLNHVRSLPVTRGDIVLLHEDYTHTTQILGRCIEHFKNRGLQLVTIDGLLAK